MKYVVQKYLDELSIIISEAITDNISETDLQFKHFFSGAAAYVKDKIFCTYTPSGIAVKIPANERAKLITSKKGSELRYFPKAPIKKDYIVLGSEIVDNTKELNLWINVAFEYACMD
ncbi:MAG: TfoX/Sxy family protein [Candidatus Heimdallarchaeota archaeon]|nr:TfoX/Sxy family protein [Candidatus Heimdallarchaeota archaeon]